MPHNGNPPHRTTRHTGSRPLTPVLIVLGAVAASAVFLTAVARDSTPPHLAPLPAAPGPLPTLWVPDGR